jgi:hypothetical protein
MMGSAAAQAVPSFPLEVPIDYCMFDDCYEMVLIVESDGSFVDSDGLGGEWQYRRASHAILFSYPELGIVLRGSRDGLCIEGRTYVDGKFVYGDRWSGCL